MDLKTIKDNKHKQEFQLNTPMKTTSREQESDSTVSPEDRENTKGNMTSVATCTDYSINGISCIYTNTDTFLNKHQDLDALITAYVPDESGTFSQRTLSQRTFSQYLQGGHLANIQNC